MSRALGSGVSLDNERGNFKLFGLIYKLYLRKFELFGARLLKKRDLERIPESWNMGLGGLVLGSLILYLRGMRILMFQLSGFYCRSFLQAFSRFLQGAFALSDPKNMSQDTLNIFPHRL